MTLVRNQRPEKSNAAAKSTKSSRGIGCGAHLISYSNSPDIEGRGGTHLISQDLVIELVVFADCVEHLGSEYRIIDIRGLSGVI